MGPDACLLALVVLGTGSPQLLPDGAAAPDGCWTIQGGSVARSSRALTELAREPGEIAWRYRPDGRIESEPLVWKDRIVLAIDRGKGKRELHWLSLETGERMGRKSFRSSLPLAPSIWEDLLAVRAEADEIELYRFIKDSLASRGSARGEGGLVSAPLLFRNEVYAIDARGLVRMRPGRSEPAWIARGTFRGEPSLLGGSVFGVAYSGGSAELVELERSSGTELGRSFLGHHGGPQPERDADLRIQLFEDDILVHHALPVEAKTAEGRPIRHNCAVLRPHALDGGVRLTDLALDAAFTPEGLFAFTGFTADALVLRYPGTGRYRTIAEPGNHDELIDDPVPPVAAGSIAIVGSVVIDPSRMEILWKLPLRPALRPVPARRSLLLVDESGELVALRHADRGRESGRLVEASAGDAPVAVEDGVAVLRDDTVFRGAFEIRVDEASLAGSGRALRGFARDLGEVALVERSDGSLVYAGEPAEVVRAVELVSRQRLAAAYADLAHESRTSRDPALMRELVELARAHGSEDDRFKNVEKKIAALEVKPATPKAAMVADLRSRADTIRESARGELWSRIERLGADAPPELELGLLRALLRTEDPGEAPVHRVRELVRETLREQQAPDVLMAVFEERSEVWTPALAGDWIEYLLVTRTREIDFVAPPEGDLPGISWDERKLGQAVVRWRPDLVSARSGRLRILSPVTQPGALARCLRTGELVCETLAEVFAEATPDPKPELPLLLYLYESKEEYLGQVDGDREEEDEDGLGWTAGIYDPSTNLQHIYLPEGESGFLRVMGTYAHELTHNWMRMQCPLFGFGEVKRSASGTGYWIEEGFADFVEEFRYDLEREEADTWNPRASHLDAVANASADQLIPWEELFRMSSSEFHELDKEADRRIRFTWRLGSSSVRSEISMFYSQSAATVFFLYHADDGARRARLFDVIRAFHTGNDEGTNVETAFEMSATELGERVVAYAQAVVQG